MIEPQPITRDGAARAAARELSKAIYHRDSDSLPVRVLHAIGRFIDHLLNTAAGHTPGGGLGSVILLGIIAAAVGMVIWRVGLPARSNPAPAILPTGTAVESASEHRLRSIHAADRRDWNVAVVERTRAVARELEERGVLDPRAGRTATELASDAAVRLPAAAVALSDAARTFNAVAYGGTTATANDLATVVAADQAVRSNSGRAAAV